MTAIFPTSKDVYFELNGKKVAVVQSYNTSYSKEEREVGDEIIDVHSPREITLN